jgi:two-component system chemotaxis response regulator CheB
MSRYRCHTGHGYTPQTLLAAQNGNLEHALWGAIRVLSERAALHRQLAHRTADRGMTVSAEKYQERAAQEEKHASTIREMLAAAPLAAEPMPAEADQTV